MTTPDPNPLLEAALVYASRGWDVFPCAANDKQPLVPKASKPGAKDGGLYLATTDPDRIKAWWRTRPTAMIGLRMGEGCRAFALDFDTYKVDPDIGRARSFAEMRRLVEEFIGCPLPATLMSATPRGGIHVLYRWTADEANGPIGNSRGALPSKLIDVRGEGGYIVISPSFRRGPKAIAEACDGKAYQWLDGAVGLPDEIADAPAPLIDALLRRGRFADRVPQRPIASSRPESRGEASKEDEAVRRYALAALDQAVGRIASAPDGRRNQTLNDEALGIGHLVGAGAVSRSVAHAALQDAAAGWGIPATDKALRANGTLDRALDAGIREPSDLSEIRSKARDRNERRSSSRAARSPPAPTGRRASSLPKSPIPLGDGGNDPGGGAGEDLDLACARLPTTDLGNAKRVLTRYGEDFLFVREWGWLTWDGRRWARGGAEDRLESAIKSTIEAIDREVLALRGSPEDEILGEKRGRIWRRSDDLAEWARKSQAAGHISCLIPLIQSDLARFSDDFDVDPMRINLENGTLVIVRSDYEPYIQLRAHDRADLITKLMPIAYDPNALCPLFDRFLDEVQPPAEDGTRPTQRFLDQWGGLSLTGDASEQKLLFMFGRGRNGKSVWMDTLASIAGDYAETVPIETFVDQGKARTAGAPTPQLAMLAGVRMLRTSEPEKGAKLAESLIKLATGGEPMKVRELNKTYFTLKVQFKLTIQGNYRPKIDGTDEGIWGRFMLIPWPTFIPKERRDKNLTAKLFAEAPGILNRLLSGLCDWMDNGLVIPTVIEEATTAYRNDNDPLGRFLAVCTRPTIGKRVQSVELHRLFCAWARASGETEWTPHGLGNAMRDRGMASKKSSSVWWLDLEFTRQVSDFVDYDGNPLKTVDDEAPRD